MLLNTTWSVLAPGFPVGAPVRTTLQELGWWEKVLLTEVSAWSRRLLYRIAIRSVKRWSDDPRNEEARKAPGLWKQAFQIIVPGPACQALIALPFTAAFIPGVRGLLSARFGVFWTGYLWDYSAWVSRLRLRLTGSFRAINRAGTVGY